MTQIPRHRVTPCPQNKSTTSASPVQRSKDAERNRPKREPEMWQMPSFHCAPFDPVASPSLEHRRHISGSRGLRPGDRHVVRLRECMLMRNRFGQLEAVSHPQHILGIAGNGTRCGASSYVEQMEASYTIQYHTWLHPHAAIRELRIWRKIMEFRWQITRGTNVSSQLLSSCRSKKQDGTETLNIYLSCFLF